ncbi:ankyrin repeat [Chlorella sorokiniana]|uniref:Ankyrin repeat n=1 Tax=Chlorella sorokiniana TaxID=3076 RepID=A0A2P6TT67_CHLSO|nr:ankyrin repeat [Chlorella sorokiniana]|eukprot:PRW57256.1 ankyrin repeat [Chlorella sorokiniana]
MGSIGSGGQRQATPHPDIPALLLAAGVDIFSRTSNSRGVRSASPLAEVASAGADATASNVFLTRAAERHAAGQWAPPPDLPMVGLVQRAVQAGCKPFFAQFWSRGYYYNTAHQLYTLIQMGLTSAVQSLLSSGAASAAAHHYGQPMLSHAVLCREPASVQLLLQHGAPVTMGAVKAAVAGRGPQPAVLRMLLAGGPAFARTTHQYWHCPVFAVLDGSCKRKWLVNPEGDVAYYRDAMVCMELMAEAGIDSYMKRDNGEVHFSPHPHYMKHHPRSSALWRAYCERATWTPTTHQQFLPSFQDAVRALLLAAHRASHQPGRGTAAGLGALPQDVLLHIVSLAAYPSSAWV